MKRTLYHDGIEVTEEDLRNTEDTKIEEILKTRTVNAHFGVLDGLALSISGSLVYINPGRAITLDGEILEVDSNIPVTSLSVDNNVYSYIGLRFIEVASLEKPHEVDPVVEQTRISTKAVASTFIAAGTSNQQRTDAMNAALAAQNQTGDFVLLAEVVGTGSSVTIVKNTATPRSKGGQDPALGYFLTTDQVNGLVNMYRTSSRERFAFASAEDEFHRSLVGSGVPTAKNAHGLSLDDLGFIDQTSVHQHHFHANGIIGFDPQSLATEYDTNLGTFNYSLDTTARTIHVQGIQALDIVHVFGVNFNNATNGNETVINMLTGHLGGPYPNGVYYIMGILDPADGVLKVILFEKTGFDAVQAAPLNHGLGISLNSSIHTPARDDRYVSIGMIRWDGANFVDLSTLPTFRVPGPVGELIYNSPSGFTLPLNTFKLDLRRWGTVTSEQIQRRSINLDRLTREVVLLETFNTHAASKVYFNGAGAFDDTVLSHVTNLQALTAFGHRGLAARNNSLEHPVANPGTFNVKPALDNNLAGFQSNVNAWRQDNYTMTILKFANGGRLNKDVSSGEVSGENTAKVYMVMDAAGVDTGENANSPIYAFARPGYFMNFCGRVGRSRDAGNITANIYIWRKIQGETPAGHIVYTLVFPPGGVPNYQYQVGPTFPFFDVSITNPIYFAVALVTPGGNSRNFTLTCEYHFA